MTIYQLDSKATEFHEIIVSFSRAYGIVLWIQEDIKVTMLSANLPNPAPTPTLRFARYQEICRP